jgi:hypothetical protein
MNKSNNHTSMLSNIVFCCLKTGREEVFERVNDVEICLTEVLTAHANTRRK